MIRFESFDQRVDAALERVRGRRPLDRLMVAASELGDFSLVWHIVGVARGLTGGPRTDQAFVFAALIGIGALREAGGRHARIMVLIEASEESSSKIGRASCRERVLTGV